MSRQQSNQRSDIYSRITNTIIADLVVDTGGVYLYSGNAYADRFTKQLL
ncbi:hypothetical protein [Rhizobium ruizarguesonis]|nr:hypothetical protein [Rhizobium ruizarguesonis]